MVSAENSNMEAEPCRAKSYAFSTKLMVFSPILGSPYRSAGGKASIYGASKAFASSIFACAWVRTVEGMACVQIAFPNCSF